MVLALLFLFLLLMVWGVTFFVLPSAWHIVSRLARGAASWTTRSPWLASRTAEHSAFRDYLPVYLILTAGIALGLSAGDEIFDLVELLRTESPVLRQVDSEMHALAATHRRSGATTFFVLMSVIGGPLFLGLLTALVVGVLLALRRFRWAAFVAVTTLGGAVMNLQLKEFFSRARPSLAEALRQAQGFSFPSGHAMGSTVVFGALSYIAYRALGPWRWRSAVIALAVTLVISVAISRVYLGVHWISDVGAGILCGLVWLTATIVAYEATRRIRLIRAIRKKRLE